jgi:hypothetical protein
MILLACGVSHAQSKKPVDVSLGWNYAYADQSTGFANLNGWYGTVNWEFSQRVGLAVQHQSFWGSFQGSEVNDHVWMAGATVKLRKKEGKVNPVLQMEAGSTRSSSQGQIQWEPTGQVALGAEISLKGNLSLEVIPAGYVFTWGNSSAQNSYQALAGLQYSFGK